MKKIFIVSILLIIVVLVGCEYGITGNAVYNSQTNDEGVELDIQPEEPLVTNTVTSSSVPVEIILGRANFRDVNLLRRGMGHIVQGTIYDSLTGKSISALDFTIYCSGQEIFTDVTDDEGVFYVTSLNGCHGGDEVWIQVEYNGKEYESRYLTIPRLVFGGSSGGSSSGSGSSGSTSINPPAGVPEFSTLTLAMAVVGGCLGLAFLRKN